MRLITLLTMAKRIIRRRLEENPEGKFKTPDGIISYQQAVDELDNLIQWTHPGLDGSGVIKVVHCKDCKHLEKELVTQGVRKVAVYKCMYASFEFIPEVEKHYCGSGYTCSN